MTVTNMFQITKYILVNSNRPSHQAFSISLFLSLYSIVTTNKVIFAVYGACKLPEKGEVTA